MEIAKMLISSPEMEFNSDFYVLTNSINDSNFNSDLPSLLENAC